MKIREDKERRRERQEVGEVEMFREELGIGLGKEGRREMGSARKGEERGGLKRMTEGGEGEQEMS